jgi:hypothetical protein
LQAETGRKSRNVDESRVNLPRFDVTPLSDVVTKAD